MSISDSGAVWQCDKCGYRSDYVNARQHDCLFEPVGRMATGAQMLADLIMEEFGREDIREPLNGVDRPQAERLAQRWLHMLGERAP